MHKSNTNSEKIFDNNHENIIKTIEKRPQYFRYTEHKILEIFEINVHTHCHKIGFYKGN